MAYKIKAGEVAYVRATDEPVFVKNIASEDSVEVRRVVRTEGNALIYGEDVFAAVELYSDKARLIKELDFLKFQAEMRDRYSREYQLNHSAVKMAATAQADGDSSLPN